MKTLNLFFFLILVNVSFTQVSRSFYTTYSDNSEKPYASGIVELNNNETRFFSIKESKPDTLVIVTGILDTEGETRDYKTYEFLNLTGSNPAVLSGVVKTNDGAEILIQSGSTSTAFHYFKYSDVNGIQLLYSTSSDYGRAIFRSQVKQDSHVVYAVSLNDGLVRISSELGNPGNSSTEVVLTPATASGTLSNPRIGTQFLISQGNVEYCWFKDKLFKRSLTGQYTSVQLNDFGLAQIYGCGISFDSSGNIALISGNNYNHVDSDLNLLSSGQIQNYNLNNSGAGIMYLEDDKYVLFATQNGIGTYEKVVVNLDFTLDSRERFTNRYWTPEFAFQDNGITKVVGRVAQFSNRHSLSFHSASNLLDPIDEFIEFSYPFSNGTVEANLQHLNYTFNNGFQSTSGFRKVRDSGSESLIFAVNSACHGITEDSLLRGLSSVFNPDFTIVSGPSPATPGSLNNYEIEDKFNRGYYVTREMIDNHVLSVSDPSYEIPLAIKHWPAHGTDGQPENLAEFYDFNSNGQYEPELGDYPSIFGDQCLLYIFHNALDSSGMECHQYYYSFDCDTSEILNNSIFLNQRFFSRFETLTDVYVGNMIDYDIGFSNDDFVGTNVELGCTYAYNGVNSDYGSPTGVGFQDSLVAAGVVYLKGAKLPSDSVDNVLGIGMNETINGYGFDDGVVDNEYFTLESSLATNNSSPPSMSDPIGELQFYNVLKGTYNYGQVQEVNGVDVRYAYFGTSDSQFYGSNGIDHGNNSSEISEGSTPGDRRMYMATGKTTLEPNDSSMVEVVTAFVSTSGNAVTSPQESVDELFALVEALKGQYSVNQAGCDLNFDPYISPNMPDIGVDEIDFNASLYPNPTNNLVTVSSSVLIEEIEVYGLNGSMLKRVQFNSAEKSFSVSELSKGVYLIRLISNGAEKVLKLIKN